MMSFWLNLHWVCVKIRHVYILKQADTQASLLVFPWITSAALIIFHLFSVLHSRVPQFLEAVSGERPWEARHPATATATSLAEIVQLQLTPEQDLFLTLNYGQPNFLLHPFAISHPSIFPTFCPTHPSPPLSPSFSFSFRSYCTPSRPRRGELSLNCLSRGFFQYPYDY